MKTSIRRQCTCPRRWGSEFYRGSDPAFAFSGSFGGLIHELGFSILREAHGPCFTAFLYSQVILSPESRFCPSIRQRSALM